MFLPVTLGRSALILRIERPTWLRYAVVPVRKLRAFTIDMHKYSKIRLSRDTESRFFDQEGLFLFCGVKRIPLYFN